MHVDTVAGVSGAACQLGPLNTIIINRREAEGRRSFDLGHELFHLITWQQMPPCHIEVNGAVPLRYKRVEQLADTVDDLADIFSEHGLKTPFDL